MIVKNEERVLDRCLKSVADLMDEIIIVDTGSTDRTKEIAAKYTDRIYDYEWIDDFSAARNFSFSKARMEYIYAPDADEVLDDENHERFRVLKECLLTEIEIVQMKYVTIFDNDVVMNSRAEYRPKLFKRLRSFTWIDRIHETVRLDPVVYDSDISILHMPDASHERRDFSIFEKIISEDGALSDKLEMMYARELLKMGGEQELLAACPYYEAVYRDDPVSVSGRRAACVLARLARLTADTAGLMKYALRDMMDKPCSEICYDLGCLYENMSDYDEAIVWYINAAHETDSLLDLHTAGDLPLLGIIRCYEALADAGNSPDMQSLYRERLDSYRAELSKWSLPELL